MVLYLKTTGLPVTAALRLAWRGAVPRTTLPGNPGN
jgi:hypothetical protein